MTVWKSIVAHIQIHLHLKSFFKRNPYAWVNRLRFIEQISIYCIFDNISQVELWDINIFQPFFGPPTSLLDIIELYQLVGVGLFVI